MTPLSSFRTRPSLFAGVLLLGLLLQGAACSPATRSASPSRASEVIRIDEIETSTASNAWDLVHQLRPNWLRSRGPASIRDPQPVYPVVYFGDINYGPLETLRGLATTGIEEIRFIGATTATTRFGSGHSGGVIQVVVRR